MENIRFAFETKDGVVHPINVSGVNNIIGAALELAQSFVDGAMDIAPEDIVKIMDIPG
jgi:hypothetical protein